MPVIVFALILAAAIGGGTSLAAQNALPGDALWGFKVNINEAVEAALAPAGEAQAYFDIAAIEERLNEASMLNKEGRLDAGAQAQLETNLNSHAKSVQAQVAALEAHGDYLGAADAAARFQAAFGRQGPDGLDVRALLDAASSLSADASAKAGLN